ncbi:unnamed protein product [Tilletia controversa]|uniref:25S rRNA adenine-N(1) methyltransferase n=3 Tax=Tilletia TaxID=13289 RepID=A0A8X7MIW7_9BASI|nr:hypothetical protein CF336_g8982 [Tilletia laevis]KAE8186757.1 hypothetical protein CF328_g7135 [Tilletia controversa]KAE8238949.1 hypothetical protein A4X03_0g8739 [Tilletia caries]KAE8183039.1 hypothetical protein CF335_g8444 [Tilletia laevis]KAE8237473.1 hypothetical protein A4X06_0g9218 [Tilletia controversa]
MADEQMLDVETGAADGGAIGEAAATTAEAKKGRREKLVRPRGKRGGIKKKHIQDRVTGKWRRTNIPANKPKKPTPAAATAATAATAAGGGAAEAGAGSEEDAEDANDDGDGEEEADAEAAPAHTTHITQFHALSKRIASPSTTAAERVKLKKELAALGGLEAYQNASLTGAGAHGESGSWVGNALKTHVFGSSPSNEKKEGEGEKAAPAKRLRLLDVGAIKGTAYDSFSSWLDVVGIDLNPRSDKVFQADFLNGEVPAHQVGSASSSSSASSASKSSAAKKELSQDEVAPGFDAVSLSLVLNFEGDLAKRAEMLLRPHAFLRAQGPSSSSNDEEEAPTGGYLALILPLPCISTSRYCTETHLISLLDSTGWEVVHRQDSKKLTRWLCREKSGVRQAHEVGCKGSVWDTWWDGKEYGRKEIRIGVKLNNFCIKLVGKGRRTGDADDHSDEESDEPLPPKKKAKVNAAAAQAKPKSNAKPRPKPKR